MNIKRNLNGKFHSISKKFEVWNRKNYRGITRSFGTYIRANFKKNK